MFSTICIYLYIYRGVKSTSVRYIFRTAGNGAELFCLNCIYYFVPIRASEVGNIFILFFTWKPVLVVLNPCDVEVQASNRGFSPYH